MLKMQIHRIAKNSIIAAIIGSSIASCSNESTKQGFSINGSNDHQADGYAYLYVLLPEYQKIMPIDSAKLKSGKFQFEGETEEPMEAYIKFSGDSLSYDFILTNNRLEMNVSSSSYSVHGSPSNRQLSKLLSYRDEFNRRRDALQKEYKKNIADSILTRTVEDSLMASYHQVGIDYRQKLVKTLSFSAPRYPLMGKMALRVFSKDLLQCQADSIKSLISE